MPEKDLRPYLPFVRVALDVIFAIASALGWRVRWINPTSPEEPKSPPSEDGRPHGLAKAKRM
jgi:hypothetical protein